MHEIGAEETHLLEHKIAHGKDAIEESRRFHQCVLVKPGLASEHVFDVLALRHGGPHDVVEHCVMAGMAFDQAAHGGHFVGVKNCAEISLFLIENGGEGGGHSHVFVREDDTWLGGGAHAQSMQRCTA